MQLRLFGPPEIHIHQKVVQEGKEGVKVKYHFNGKPL